jgi:hypothetical protein
MKSYFIIRIQIMFEVDEKEAEDLYSILFECTKGRDLVCSQNVGITPL